MHDCLDYLDCPAGACSIERAVRAEGVGLALLIACLQCHAQGVASLKCWSMGA